MASAADASGVLDDVSRVRERTRLYRNGHWFASVVFGVVILGALPYYMRSTPVGRMHCHSIGHGVSTCVGTVRKVPLRPLGRAFEAQPFSSVGSWSTLYWTIAVVIGFGAVIAYYHLRARKVGVQGRLWPAVAAGFAILVFGMWINYGSNAEPADFWIRGTSVLVVIALGLIVLSALERSRPFVVFAVGFLGLALLSNLYNVVNLFQRLHIGGPFTGNGSTLPNLVLPGAYLLVGGLLFLVARPWKLHVQVRLARVES
jgi:hypothetical protein